MGKRQSKKVNIHAHECTGCGSRYEDNCRTLVRGPRGGMKETPGPNGLCYTCKTGNPAPWWPEARLPRDCCRQESRPASPEELKKFRLVGGGRWYICPVCYRTFPGTNPAKEEEKYGTASRT